MAQVPEERPVPRFPKATKAWRSDAFAGTLKAEIEDLDAGSLPLEQGVTQGGFVDDEKITALVLTATSDKRYIFAEVGVFFSEIVAGCSCGDEPDSINVYCRLKLRIDRGTETAEVQILPE